jgi:hypothetical protein
MRGTLRNNTIFKRTSKLNAGNVNKSPEYVAHPDSDGETNKPANEETKTILEVRFLAGMFPNIGHDRVTQTVENRTVNDVESEGNLAQVLGERVCE